MEPASQTPPPVKRLSIFQNTATLAAGAALFLSLLFVLQDIIPAILWAGVLAVALWSSYRRIRNWRPSDLWQRVGAPAFFTILIGLAVAIPIAFAAFELSQEARAILGWIEAVRRTGEPVPDAVRSLPLIGQRVAGWWHDNLSDPRAATELFRQIGPSQLLGLTRNLGMDILNRALSFFVALVTLFFLFRDGEYLSRRLLGLGEKAFGARSTFIAYHVVDAIHGTVDGLVLVGLAEGAVIGTAYWIAGVPHAAVFTIVTSILAAIPLGAPLTFCAASLLLIGTGHAIPAVALLIFAFVVVSVADHLVRPIVIGGSTRIPFLLVLLGILGGLSSLGLVGLFVGPALMAVLMAIWRDLADPAPPQ